MPATKSNLKKIRGKLRNNFIFITVGGGILIFLLFGSLKTDYLALIPLIPMAIYIVIGYQTANKYKHMPDFSDSVYYMGFIFTLISLLSVVLTSKIINEPEQLINYFGMALSSTIAGITFRSIHHQFTNFSHDPIDDARREIQEEVNDFKESVTEMREKIELFSNTLSSTLPNKIEESINKFDEQFNVAFNILNQNIDNLNSSTSNLHNKINSSTSNIATMVDTIEDSTNQNIENLSNTMDEMKRVLNKLKEQNNNYLRKISSKNQDNLLDVTLSSLQQSNNDFIELSNKIQSTVSSWNETNSAFQKTSSTLKTEINKIKKMFKEMGDLIEKKFK